MIDNPPDSRVDFKQQQARFTAYIRNPDKNPVPEGIKQDRMAMYAELLFNNIESFLSGNFPVLKKIHTKERWLQLVRDFFAEHQAQTPYFAEIPQEFLTYLQDERNYPDDYPFLLELAHYEWVEMALALAQEQVIYLNNIEIANLAEEPLIVSPLAWPLAYQYPVQSIAPDNLPAEVSAELTYIIVYRDSQDEVQFLKITPMTYQLVVFVQNNQWGSCLEVLKQFVRESAFSNPDLILKSGLELLQNLAEKGIFIKRVLPE